MLRCLRGCLSAIISLAITLPLIAEASDSRTFELIEETATTVTIQQIDEDNWRASFTFKQPQSTLFFSRSHNNYRVSRWQAVSEGARIERLGHYDALLFDQPTHNAEFVFQPFTGTMQAGYTPFIPFSNGSMAMYTGQFELLSANNADEVKKLDEDLSNWQGEQGWVGVRVISNKRIVQHGRIVSGEATDRFYGNGSYIYIGDGRITESSNYVGVIDSALPPWLLTRFDEELGTIFNTLESLYGKALDSKPTILFSFRGDDQNTFSYKGGTMYGNAMVLEISGQIINTENTIVLNLFRNLIAHEGAHLFQKVNRLRQGSISDSWIHEGGATAANMYALFDLGIYNKADWIKSAGDAFRKCTDYLQDGTIGTAPRHPQQAHYFCGELFAYMSDAALKQHDYFDFWNAFIAFATQNNDKGRYDTDEYLATLLALGANKELVSGMATLVDKTVEQPASFLKSLMKKSGLAPVFDPKDQLVDMKIPVTVDL